MDIITEVASLFEGVGNVCTCRNAVSPQHCRGIPFCRIDLRRWVYIEVYFLS